jgi:histidine triad (HIT) family protein
MSTAGGSGLSTIRVVPDTTMDPGCIFCRIVAGELPSTVVASTERSLAFMDISPATYGHLLVVPRRHTRDITTVDAEDLADAVLLAQRMARRVRERLGADGVNLLQSSGEVAWQTVFHLHLHVVPRYAGDPLVLPWRPAAGDPARIARAAAQLADGSSSLGRVPQADGEG